MIDYEILILNRDLITLIINMHYIFHFRLRKMLYRKCSMLYRKRYLAKAVGKRNQGTIQVFLIDITDHNKQIILKR